MAACAVIALVIVWSGYFFHVSRLTVKDGTLTATFPNWHETIVKPVKSPNYSVIVPAGEFIQGFREVLRHNRHGQRAFFLGRVSQTGGWKLYYPVTILLKWPATVLVLSLLGVAAFLRRKLPLPAAFWIMTSFPLLYFLLAIQARFNLGDRHVLPLYPFVLLVAAALWERLNIRAAGRVLLLLLAGANVVDTLRFAPGYLSYSSPFVNVPSYQLLTDSNLDWGQGLLAVRHHEQEHPGEPISLAYFGSVGPSLYGIKARPLPEHTQVTGTVIVSATSLSGQFLSDPAAYRWLLRYQPVEVLDHAMYVYKIGNASGPAQPGP